MSLPMAEKCMKGPEGMNMNKLEIKNIYEDKAVLAAAEEEGSRND